MKSIYSQQYLSHISRQSKNISIGIGGQGRGLFAPLEISDVQK